MQCFKPKCSQSAELSADASNLERKPTESTTKPHKSKITKYNVLKLCNTNKNLSKIQSGFKKNFKALPNKIMLKYTNLLWLMQT